VLAIAGQMGIKTDQDKVDVIFFFAVPFFAVHFCSTKIITKKSSQKLIIIITSP
jgi:hypothetical protein